MLDPDMVAPCLHACHCKPDNNEEGGCGADRAAVTAVLTWVLAGVTCLAVDTVKPCTAR